MKLTVLMPPIRTMNPLTDRFLATCIAMMAAWAEPRPGIIPVRLPDPTAARIALRVSAFFRMMVSVMNCLGMVVFSFNDTSNVLTPNNPESMGKRGWLRLGKLKTKIPRTPDIVKMKVAQNFALRDCS